MPSGPQRTTQLLRLTLIGLIVAGVAYGVHSGTFASFADRAVLKARFADMGAAGYVAFVLAYTLLQPFGVPGTVFVFAAPLIWPWPIAFAVSMAGTMGASVVGYSTARFIARDFLERRLSGRWRRYDEALQRNAFRTVFLLRLIFWMPQALHAWFGVSSVGFWTHFWGSLAGYALPLLVVSLYGEATFDQFAAHPVRSIAITLGLFSAGWGIYAWRERRQRG